jgi:hypothetical protein
MGRNKESSWSIKKGPLICRQISFETKTKDQPEVYPRHINMSKIPICREPLTSVGLLAYRLIDPLFSNLYYYYTIVLQFCQGLNNAAF